MALRERFTAELKTAMLAHDAPRVSVLRMITSKLKDVDIAARPKGMEGVPDDEILAMLRSMVKSRRESVELYRQGNRPELAAKEEAEIGVIEAFLPIRLDQAAMSSVVDLAVAETGASTIKDMGRVMAFLRSKHGAILDMAQVGLLVKGKLGA